MHAQAHIVDCLHSEFNWCHRPSVNQLLMSLDMQQALTALTHALQLHPNNGFLLGHYGKVCLRESKLHDAKDYLERALTTESRDPSLLFSLGVTHLELDAQHEALPWLKRAVDLTANADHILVLIRTACSVGDFDTALSACLTGLDAHPEDERMHCAYPQTLLYSGDPKAALLWLESSDRSNSAALAQLQYNVHSHLGQPIEAQHAQQEYQRRVIQSQDGYRERAIAVLDALPDEHARLALVAHWENNLDSLMDTR